MIALGVVLLMTTDPSDADLAAAARRSGIEKATSSSGGPNRRPGMGIVRHNRSEARALQ
jgi:hypothetical protein